MQFLIFKENPNAVDLYGNHKDHKLITEDIKLLGNILIEIISDNNSKNLTIENLIEIINCFLKKCNIREISVEMKNNKFSQNSNLLFCNLIKL